MKIEAFALTDKGNTRAKNQDAYGIFPNEHFYVIADGVGGHQGGEVAAVETVNQLFYGIHRLYNLISGCSQQAVQNLLTLNVSETNQIVINKGKAHQDLQGMASTFCFIFAFSNVAYYSHYGDSRIYLFREKKLSQLTKDHTVAQELKDSNQVVYARRQENTLTKAIGLTAQQTASVKLEPIQSKDIFLLCTDGLTEKFKEGDLQGYLSRNQSSDELLREMILDARNRGAKDNITAMLLKVV